ncbi:MAG: hypothetical protein AABN34_18505 [Acidobacteriota bacterium]
MSVERSSAKIPLKESEPASPIMHTTYSCLSAIIGSTFVARRAGTKQAIRATRQNQRDHRERERISWADPEQRRQP